MLNPADPPLAATDELFAPLAGAAGLLIAVSGGPDSMALLHMSARWRASRAGPPVRVATVDHGLRPGSREEAEAVAVACGALGLEHAILTWRGEKPASRLQERARAARYDLLAAHARAGGLDTIVTAHHAGDQAETVLMRLQRGSGPAGLAGMRPLGRVPGNEDILLARPLLGVAKADLVALCHALGQAFFEDPGNDSAAFARGRARRLAPLLAREGLDGAALLRLAARAGRAEAALAALAAERIAALPADRTPEQFTVARAALAGLPEEVLLRLMAGEIARLTGARPRLERLERAGAALRAALAAGANRAGTLGGTTWRLTGARLTVAPARPRGR